MGRVIRKEGVREAWNLPSLGFAIPFPLCLREVVREKNKGVFLFGFVRRILDIVSL